MTSGLVRRRRLVTSQLFPAPDWLGCIPHRLGPSSGPAVGHQKAGFSSSVFLFVTHAGRGPRGTSKPEIRMDNRMRQSQEPRDEQHYLRGPSPWPCPLITCLLEPGSGPRRGNGARQIACGLPDSATATMFSGLPRLDSGRSIAIRRAASTQVPIVRTAPITGTTQPRTPPADGLVLFVHTVIHDCTPYVHALGVRETEGAANEAILPPATTSIPHLQ